MKYKGIIFDFNGTLFFDSKKHYDAWIEYSKRLRGTSFSDDEMRKYMFGRTNEDIITYCTGRKPEPELCEKLSREKEALYREMCINDKENFHLAPYAQELLDFLCEKNIPHTIATMSIKENVDFYIKEMNLAKWFDVEKIVYDDGTVAGKPAPDIYLKAAKKLGIEPKDCIVVEDAISGIQAAEAAGIGKIIAIASLESTELYKNIPCVSQVITDYSNFDTELFEK